MIVPVGTGKNEKQKFTYMKKKFFNVFFLNKNIECFWKKEILKKMNIKKNEY